MPSAVEELQHFLASPPTGPQQPPPQQQQNPVANAHAQLQVLRDEGDSNLLFLRCILELSSQQTSMTKVLSQSEEELLFHCITGCRHVLLVRWTTYSSEFRSTVRDYFLGMAFILSSGDNTSSSSTSSSLRTIQNAYFNACASFWKRSWVEDVQIQKSTDEEGGKDHRSNTISPIEQSILEHMHRHFPQSIITRLMSPEQLLSQLQQILTKNVTTPSEQQQQQATARFLTVLVGEFSGKSASQYHLPLQFHKQAHHVFERGLLADQKDQVVVGLHQCLIISMTALGQWVPKMLMDGTDMMMTCDEVVLAIIQLTIDVIGWEWGAEEAWDTTGNTVSGTTSSLVRPPTQWKDILLQPDFVTAIFQLHHTKWRQQHHHHQQQQHAMAQTTSQLLHSIRQLLLLLASLTGSIFSSTDERKQFSTLLMDGTMGLLQTPEIACREDPILVDTLSLISRLFINYKMSTLVHLPFLPNVLESFASIGRRLLQDTWVESQQTAGDLELMENLEWREEALRLIVEGLVILCSDPWLLYSGSEESRQSARTALARTLGPLYIDFVTCRTQMARLEEMYYMAHDTELDEIREEIFAVDLEEEMTSLANVGRLDLGASLGCLSNRFQQLIPQLQSLWEGGMSIVTPEAAGLLEESRLITVYVGHLLTDDNDGETPVIPDSILVACQQQQQTNDGLTALIISAVETIQQFAEAQATKIAQNPSDPRWSPLLAKDFLWFLHRWAPAYILPVDYGGGGGGSSSSGGVNPIVQAWANPQKVQETVSFIITLCLHYHCHWPQERQVQENASILLQAMAKRCKPMRLALVATPAFRELTSFHCWTSGIRHSAPFSELESTVRTKAGHADNTTNLRFDLIHGYQRLPYDVKSKILTGLLIGCSEYDDEFSKNLLNHCLEAVHEAFSSLVHALSSKTLNPSHVDAKEMAALCVELYGGVARAGEMVASERISTFLTPSLLHLSGLMGFYADDLTICESLLRLFRDYAEQFIAVLESESCRILFQASADLLKHYSAIHCSSTRVIMVRSMEEEQSYNDILCAIQLLIQLGTKDFIGFADNNGGMDSSQVTDMIFFGLQQIIPLMTRGLLQFPTLCGQYFSLVGFMMETYPEKVKDVPYDLFVGLLESLLFGMSHHDVSVGKTSLQGLMGIMKEHTQHRVLDIHLNTNPQLLDNCSCRLLMDVIFQTCVWDRMETAGMALLYLTVVDWNRFTMVVQSICQKIPLEQQGRLSNSFERLLQPEILSKALTSGYEGRQNRIRFKKDFEHFCHEIHSFLILK